MQLMPFMRAEPEFVLHTEVLADRAYELGGTDLARKEYQRGLELMAVGRASPRYVLPEHMENRLRIKLAKSLYTGGQYEMSLKQIGMLGEPMQEWVKLDLQYIEEWSLLLDLKIMLRLVPAVLKGSGAV